jgi:5-methylcytosine-specific restriction endonuclease McrA
MGAISSESGRDFIKGFTVTKPGDENTTNLKTCLRDPIPEIFDAARYLDAAVSAHLAGKVELADELFRLADNPAISKWTESLWGKGGPWTQAPLPVKNPAPHISEDQRSEPRMPTKSQMAALLERDGYRCRFCGIPVIRREVREKITQKYPDAARWKSRNVHQHAAFQAMWLQYDHLLPHSRGGVTDLSNLVITCAPCNFGRTELTLEEVGLLDPRLRNPIRSTWDGLERFR